MPVSKIHPIQKGAKNSDDDPRSEAMVVGVIDDWDDGREFRLITGNQPPSDGQTLPSCCNLPPPGLVTRLARSLFSGLTRM